MSEESRLRRKKLPELKAIERAAAPDPKPLLALIEKWREKQRMALIEPTTSQVFRAGALGACADELEGLLNARRVGHE